MREYYFDDILVKRGGADQECPFDISATTKDEQFHIRVKPGTVGGKLITNYNQDIKCNKTGTQYIIINASTNGKWITGAQIAVENNAPSPQTPTESGAPSTLKVLIGLVVEGSIFKTLGCENVVTKPVVAHVLDKTPPIPAGSSPLRYFFIWDGV